MLKSIFHRFQILKTTMYLAWLGRKAKRLNPGSLQRCLNYSVLINDGPNFYTLYKDIFINQIYHFEAQRPDPLILDCGSNIGMSILYFRHVYPQARIIGFEPDPTIFSYLQQNILRNGLTGVQLIQGALARQEGTLTFFADGKYGSYLKELVKGNVPAGWTKHMVPCHRLREYLVEPVDFLKMNIEGAEWDVLADSTDRLKEVREMVIEYHHLPGLPRTLHRILGLLNEKGFRFEEDNWESPTLGAWGIGWQVLVDGMEITQFTYLNAERTLSR